MERPAGERGILPCLPLELANGLIHLGALTPVVNAPAARIITRSTLRAGVEVHFACELTGTDFIAGECPIRLYPNEFCRITNLYRARIVHRWN